MEDSTARLDTSPGKDSQVSSAQSQTTAHWIAPYTSEAFFALVAKRICNDLPSGEGWMEA